MMSDLALPDGKFGAILVDPPWRFRTWSETNQKKSASRHYPLMTLDEIKALPVLDLAAPDCALFLWVTRPMLPQALDVVQQWGRTVDEATGKVRFEFTFKTVAFTWVKTTKDGRGHPIGCGYWSRANPEQCWLFTRGHPKRLPTGTSVRELIEEPRREHSRKPDCIHERIERLVAGDYCELFARQSWPNWTTWGNEDGKFDELTLDMEPPRCPV